MIPYRNGLDLPPFLRVLLLALVCHFTAPPLYAAGFVINSLDSPGEGFNDPTPVIPVGGNNGTTLGQQRMYVFLKAAQIWGAAIETAVPIVIQASFDPLSCNASSAILGGAGPIYIVRDFIGAPEPNTWYHVALANAIAGFDLIPDDDDIGVVINSSIDNNNNCLYGTGWYLGFDHNHGSDIDLLVVLLHEFAHGLGFSSFVDLDDGSFFYGIQDIYSHYALDNSTGMHWNEMTDEQRRISATNTGNVVWDGVAVTAGTAGFLTAGSDPAGHPQLYAPTPLDGSSISHFDIEASPNLLMEPYISDELASDLDLTDEQLFDIGWPAVDSDHDGVSDSNDNCVDTANPDQTDTDSDQIGDACDNCILMVNPNQLDTDDDGFGNVCDADFDNSLFVNFADLSYFKTKFGTADPDADFDGNGFVNFADLATFKTLFGKAPGPSCCGTLSP